MSLTFITGNAGKFSEAQLHFPDLHQLDIDLDEIQEIDAKKVITHKLQEALKHHSGELIVEDTSLYIETLNGLPGPLIKWFLKAQGTAGLAQTAQKLGNQNAVARTFIGYAKSADDIHFFEGEVSGQIVLPRGTNGFGWDAIFQPKNELKTFAELTTEEKQKYSMRNQALKKLKYFLDSAST